MSEEPRKISGRVALEDALKKWADAGEALKLAAQAAELAAEVALAESEKLGEFVALPDIGVDPCQSPVAGYNREEAAIARLCLARDIQQKDVPDQTALVWRIDISRLHGAFILARARAGILEAELKRLKG